MKQTAVQWFWDKIALKLSLEQVNEFLPQLEQAKEMEKEQIEMAYKWGNYSCSDYDAEQYYKKQYVRTTNTKENNP